MSQESAEVRERARNAARAECAWLMWAIDLGSRSEFEGLVRRIEREGIELNQEAWFGLCFAMNFGDA